MNTIKDECDGWHDPETSGYPLAYQAVIIALKNGGYSIARWNGYGWVTVANQSNVRDIVTHWRELPEPPKPKDAFGKWWYRLKQASFDEDFHRLVETQYGNDVAVSISVAKAIWEAAINSTKQC